MKNSQAGFSVQDLAERYRRTVRTIRYWRTLGLIPPPDYHVIRSPRWHPRTVRVIDRNVQYWVPNRSTKGQKSLFKKKGRRSAPSTSGDQT